MLIGEAMTRHPLFACVFRPLFLATALYAAIGIALWMGALLFGLVLPSVAGGIVVWHAHELMFGFGLAALAGFVLTAVPEFTATPPFGRRAILAIVSWWLVARVAFWLSGTLGPWPAAIANAGFALLLPALLGVRLLRDPERRYTGFFWGLAAFALVATGFQVDALRGLWPMRWMHASIGVMMTLIVVAMSRISMRIVNDALDALRARTGDDPSEYRARPPRRNFAIFAIVVHGLAEFFVPASPVTGWLALAAAAAVLNLLNDWHVGRALLGRWPLMLYAVYALMAAGYATMGLMQLGGASDVSAGRHLLTVGAMGLSIFAVLCIAGRMHAGRPLDDEPWTPIGAALLVFAALARAMAEWPGAPGPALIGASALAWTLAFGLVLRHLGPVWCSARDDGGQGCDEWSDAAAAAPDALQPAAGCERSFSTSASLTCANSP